jgi:hypothetical protein
MHEFSTASDHSADQGGRDIMATRYLIARLHGWRFFDLPACWHGTLIPASTISVVRPKSGWSPDRNHLAGRKRPSTLRSEMRPCGRWNVAGHRILCACHHDRRDPGCAGCSAGPALRDQPSGHGRAYTHVQEGREVSGPSGSGVRHRVERRPRISPGPVSVS